MSTPKKKKKVVVTTAKRAKAAPTVSKRATVTTQKQEPVELIFGKENYYWMALGVGLIVLGMFLMTGGEQPSPEVWDDSIIYSFRRITLAPILILAGVVVEVIAIFK